MPPYVHRLRVRYGETDQMGVVHHANYLLYLEEARTEYMRSLGCAYGELERAGIGLPVRRAELRYRSPALYEEELAVEVWVERLKAASLTFAYRVLRAADGELLSEATVELACVRLTAHPRKPCMLPEDVRARLAEGTLGDGPPA